MELCVIMHNWCDVSTVGGSHHMVIKHAICLDPEDQYNKYRQSGNPFSQY